MFVAQALLTCQWKKFDAVTLSFLYVHAVLKNICQKFSLMSKFFLGLVQKRCIFDA